MIFHFSEKTKKIWIENISCLCAYHIIEFLFEYWPYHRVKVFATKANVKNWRNIHSIEIMIVIHSIGKQQQYWNTHCMFFFRLDLGRDLTHLVVFLFVRKYMQKYKTKLYRPASISSLEFPLYTNLAISFSLLSSIRPSLNSLLLCSCLRLLMLMNGCDSFLVYESNKSTLYQWLFLRGTFSVYSISQMITNVFIWFIAYCFK